MQTNERYWAMEQNPDDVIEHIKNRRDWKNAKHPMLSLWQRGYDCYYKNALVGDGFSGLEFSGERGEIIHSSVNETRSLISQFVSLVTKQRLTFEPLLATSDTGAISDARVARSLCEWTVTAKHMDKKGHKLAESGAIFGIGFIAALWRAELGEDYSGEGGQIVKTGDVHVYNLLPTDVFFDHTVSDWEDLDEVEFRVKVNRWTMYALHGKQEIIDVDGARRGNLDNDTDKIWVYYWFHVPTPGMPNGRRIVSLEDGTVLYDAANDYECLPIEAFIPESMQDDLMYGFAKILDLCPLQESHDTVHSAIVTNISALGIQCIASPKGNEIEVSNIGELQFLKYTPMPVPNGGVPQPLNLVQQAADAYKFLDTSRLYMTELSGLNGALRGTPPAGVTSGVALATLTANALEFMARFSGEWQATMQSVMTLIVRIYAKFAKTPLQIPIAGRNNQTIVREFIGKQVENVKKVQFSVSNPQQLTVGGRIAIAESLLSNGLIKDPMAYIELIFTGSIEGVVEAPLDTMHLIRSENDDLSAGIPVVALITDKHDQHILHHLELLSDADLRRKTAAVRVDPNPENVKAAQAVKNITDHILEHRQLLEDADPVIRAIVDTGKAPAPVEVPPGPGPVSPMPQQPEGPQAAQPAQPLNMEGMQ